MDKLLQNESIRKYGFFIVGLLLSAIGTLVAFEGETSFIYKLAFMILSICGAIQVIATFIKDKWKSTEKIFKNSFTYSGYVLMTSVVWEHLVNGIIRVPIWGLVLCYLFVIAGLFIGVAKVMEVMNRKSSIQR
ncbi:hypothetical protein ACFYKX_09430 [Cytobacillus sp. FJAT-54145]|uniref:DUF3021 domain-containing protein n=1 Tax=Cytobacillus spartinae TaxID=3299023 RepID=A0ABW6KC76_9BACI